MSRARRGVAGVVVALFAMTACGDDGGGGAVDADDYVEDVCDALTSWRDAIGERGDDIRDVVGDDAEPEEGKEVLEDFFAETVKETDDLVDAVDEAGEPDVDDGDEVADAVKDAVEIIRKGMEDAREAVADMPTDDDDEFQEAAQEIVADMQGSISGSLDGLEEDNPDLVELFEDTECAFGTDVSDFVEQAEEVIADSGATDVECDEPDDTDVGTTFECTATFDDGTSTAFTAEITEEDQITVTPVAPEADDTETTIAPVSTDSEVAEDGADEAATGDESACLLDVAELPGVTGVDDWEISSADPDATDPNRFTCRYESQGTSVVVIGTLAMQPGIDLGTLTENMALICDEGTLVDTPPGLGEGGFYCTTGETPLSMVVTTDQMITMEVVLEGATQPQEVHFALLEALLG